MRERENDRREQSREEKLRAARRRKKAARVRRNRRIAACLLMLAALVIMILCSGFLMKADADTEHPTYKYYTEIRVGRGDSLWSIAQQYCTEEYADLNEYIREVCRINSIYDDTIFYGQYLMVPYYSDILR
ncbi:MAG: LysM peptidoglycan-binding domain-containing protein [Eubacteriales bacterium]|nr:LysM peptidoglycan-binding domain-containing protein [Eubacteriales bacterium]